MTSELITSQPRIRKDHDWLGDDVPEFSADKKEKDFRGVSFNKHFVECFSDKMYEKILSDREVLASVGDNYLHQYDDNSSASAVKLAFKESLDHYILSQLTSENTEKFIQSEAFSNYSSYIMNIAENNFMKVRNGELFSEIVANPVLRNEKMRELILEKTYPPEKARRYSDSIKKQIDFYQKGLSSVEEIMDKRGKLSQKQVDYLGDYLYSSKKYDDGLAKKFAEYCFNEIHADSDIKPSTQMIGALTNYFAYCYSLDEKVRRDSRFIIANYSHERTDESGNIQRKSVHVGVSTSFGCVLEQNHFTRMSLMSDDSLSKSRTNTYNDIYRLMMVSFHELTHDHQRNQMMAGDDSSSSMSYILHNVLMEDKRECFPRVGKDGSIHETSYYKANHDCDEIEIEADEEAWRQCRTFLVNHRQQYAWDHHDDDIYRQYSEQRGKCLDNEEEVRTRRAFTRKIDATGQEMSYIQYDIENLKSFVANDPKLLQRFPQLNKYLDQDGNLRSELLLEKRIGGIDTSDNLYHRTDDFGVEVGTYIITNNEDVKNIISHINNSTLSSQQVQNLMTNLWNIIHQNALKVRQLKKANFDNYDETETRMGFTPQEMKDAFLKQYLRQLYNSVHIAEVIRGTHPELGDYITRQEEGYMSSYYDELQHEGKVKYEEAKKIYDKYQRTNNPVLMKIATKIARDYQL